jgi:hypothetical protein
MRNKIIFIQDIDGERAWLSARFLNHINLETIFSGKWGTDHPREGDNSYLYEVSYQDHNEDPIFFDSNLPKIKSVYSNSRSDLFFSKCWAISDEFIHDLTFENKIKSKNFIILNLARSGTMFTRTIVSKKLNEFRMHESDTSRERNIELSKIIKDNDLTVFLVYRKDAWNWCTSNLIAKRFGYYHHNSYHKNIFTAMTADRNDLDNLIKTQLATWDFWCNLKCYLPDLNCYLLEFDDIIKKYKNITNHTAIPYVKNDIITNYQEIQNVFDDEYQSIFDKIITNGSNHLKHMNCKTDLSDLDLFAK